MFSSRLLFSRRIVYHYHLRYPAPIRLPSFGSGFCTYTPTAMASASLPSFLDAVAAQKLDEDLMGEDVGYSVDQLMELAGLSVAQAIVDCFPFLRKVLIVVGPGNNGGDGLVAARHLCHFGYHPVVLYPKQPDKLLYKRLLRQLHHHRVPVLTETPGVTALMYMFGYLHARMYIFARIYIFVWSVSQRNGFV
eukprot:GHVS01027177.1.p1 GENE.GHVS01027177.1~~GHVS01027177.1.p1  ORF type:complete len:192 (-),score=21.27 GHVS01027177.1:141-716(-)